MYSTIDKQREEGLDKMRRTVTIALTSAVHGVRQGITDDSSSDSLLSAIRPYQPPAQSFLAELAAWETAKPSDADSESDSSENRTHLITQEFLSTHGECLTVRWSKDKDFKKLLASLRAVNRQTLQSSTLLNSLVDTEVRRLAGASKCAENVNVKAFINAYARLPLPGRIGQIYGGALCHVFKKVDPYCLGCTKVDLYVEFYKRAHEGMADSMKSLWIREANLLKTRNLCVIGLEEGTYMYNSCFMKFKPLLDQIEKARRALE